MIICGFADALSCGGGGGSGGGGEGDGGGGGGGNGGGDPPPPPPPTPEQIAAQKDEQIQAASGNAPEDAFSQHSSSEARRSNVDAKEASSQPPTPSEDGVGKWLDITNRFLSATSGFAAGVALIAGATGAAPVAAAAGIVSITASALGVVVTAAQLARGDIKPREAIVSIGLNVVSAGAGFLTRAVDILRTKSAAEILGYMTSRTASVVGLGLAAQPAPLSPTNSSGLESTSDPSPLTPDPPDPDD